MSAPPWIDRLAGAAAVGWLAVVLLFDDPKWMPATWLDDVGAVGGLVATAVVAVAALRWRRQTEP